MDSHHPLVQAAAAAAAADVGVEVQHRTLPPIFPATKASTSASSWILYPTLIKLFDPEQPGIQAEKHGKRLVITW
jgi:hypothetical protein